MLVKRYGAVNGVIVSLPKPPANFTGWKYSNIE